MDFTLDFEKPVQDLENKIKELKDSHLKVGIDLSHEIEALQKKVDALNQEIYDNLTPWERVQLSRHPERPHALEHIKNIISDFHEIHGDRRYFDDASMVTGFGYLEGKKVCVIAIEKGRKTQEKIKRNFGMSSPEGYRKALRVMNLASQFHLPIITFVDTPGAYPGIGAEERGQASAIAENLEAMFRLESPIVSIIIGEGGSGGALGIAIADEVFMMEYSVYSVISPESCASILWSDPKKAEDAANSLKLDPTKALELNVIDGVIREPRGGAQKDPQLASQLIKESVLSSLKKLESKKIKDLLEDRFSKFRRMGNQTILADKEGIL